MVTTKLYGRLGTQMFQIAAALGTATRNGTGCKIPILSEENNTWRTYFTALPELEETDKPDLVYKEKGFGYQDIPYVKGELVCLDGYFQSEKYFDHCRRDILAAFQIPYEMLPGAIGIHVRRGDDLRQRSRPLCTMDYYRKAVSYFAEKTYQVFIVYSDDIAWCKANFKGFPQADVHFLFSSNTNEIKDLESMACCEHNIISNSSFSWWGAWLNRNPNKTVIAPEKWFVDGNESLRTNDLIPENWIRM